MFGVMQVTDKDMGVTAGFMVRVAAVSTSGAALVSRLFILLLYIYFFEFHGNVPMNQPELTLLQR